MRAARGVLAAVALIVGAGTVAGCGSSPGSKASGSASHKLGGTSVSVAVSYRPPKQAALSWLVAINHKDRAAVLAHFERTPGKGTWENGDQSVWASGGTWRWPTFSALHCDQMSRSATTAWVRCTFKESVPIVEQRDSFWSVYLHRQPDGRWLITDYGQP
jgi:hypothetical protein